MKIELEKTNEVRGIRIFSLRGKQLMLDSELAGLYNVETKQLNRLVKRNAERFPSTFMFQIDQGEWENLRYQYGTSSLEYGGRRHLPYVFTEQGVSVTIYSTKLSKQTLLDVSKFNEKYEPVFIKKLDNLHDRFLIIDHKEMYHLGASLKDLGKKIFAFSKMNSETHKILAKLV